jgi:hypothetical protein
MSEIKARVGQKSRKPEPDERIRGRITMSPVEPGSGMLGAPIAGLDIDVLFRLSSKSRIRMTGSSGT